MRKILVAPLAVLALVGFAAEGSAQTTTTATASFEVTAINEISVSGNPGALVIDSRADLNAGVADSTTTWGVSTNAVSTAAMKVTGQIESAMPTGVTLSVSLAAPSAVGTSTGLQALGVTGVDLVTGLSTVNEVDLPVVYQLNATESAAVVTDSRTVTYTITAQ